MPWFGPLSLLVLLLPSAACETREPAETGDKVDSVEPPSLAPGNKPPKPAFEPPGMHWRIETPQGWVHVWHPENLRKSNAGVVVYVHGYYTDVDGAWSEHSLAEQFWLSRQNAVFVVPEAPRGDADKVVWEDLESLLKTVFRKIRRRRPAGPLVVVGHSGAYRTIMGWLSHSSVRQIILLDGLYAGEDEFAKWLRAGDGRRRLLLMSVETLDRAKRLAARFKSSVDLPRVPESFDAMSRSDRNAPLIHIQSPCDHMELVTAGQVLPALLRLSPLRGLGNPPPRG